MISILNFDSLIREVNVILKSWAKGRENEHDNFYVVVEPAYVHASQQTKIDDFIDQA